MYLVYAPELMLMDCEPGEPLDEEQFVRWATPRFDEDNLKNFIRNGKPGDFISTKDITVVRLGKDWSE